MSDPFFFVGSLMRLAMLVVVVGTAILVFLAVRGVVRIVSARRRGRWSPF